MERTKLLQRNRLSANFCDGRQLAEGHRAFIAITHHPLDPVQLTRSGPEQLQHAWHSAERHAEKVDG